MYNTGKLQQIGSSSRSSSRRDKKTGGSHGGGRGTLRGHEKEVRSVSVSKDGKRIASGSDDKTVKIWDAEELEELITLEGT